MQEIQRMKKLMTAMALAMLAASPAFAATKHSHMSASPAASGSYAAADTDYSAYDPDVVVDDGQIVGRDPDPNIRFQIMRDHGLLAD